MTTEPTPELNLAILSPEGFEDLIEALFKAEMEQAKRSIRENVPISYNVISVEKTGRGSDEGKDLFVVTLIGDCVDTWQFNWLVQCNTFAKLTVANLVLALVFIGFLNITKHGRCN